MNYPSKELMKNISPVARSLSEANRDAQYCTAIQVFKSETKLTLDFAINAVWGALITLAIASPFVVGIYIWSQL
jgi:hypothetical protein